MTVYIEVRGDKTLAKKLEKLAQMGDQNVKNALKLAALDVQKEAIQSIQQGGRSGKTYKANKSGATRQASAPGEPPKSQTGNLVRNITVQEESEYSVTVGSRGGAGYGKYLEMGTSRMAPRPWLKPALEKNTDKINKRLADAVKKATENA